VHNTRFELLLLRVSTDLLRDVAFIHVVLAAALPLIERQILTEDGVAGQQLDHSNLLVCFIDHLVDALIELLRVR